MSFKSLYEVLEGLKVSDKANEGVRGLEEYLGIYSKNVNKIEQ